MKRTFQKLTALALALIMALSVFAICALAAETAAPTVYIHGYGDSLYADANSTENPIWPVELPEDYASQVVEKIKKPLAKGTLLGQWDDFHNLVIGEVSDIYGGIALDHNGEPSNGSGTPGAYKGGPLPNLANGNGKYNLTAYWFEYDWRLDPCYLADLLNEYINAVLDATGAEKVNLVGRCYGANIVLAYLDKYKSDKIGQICFYSAGFRGFEFVGALLSGEMDVDPDVFTTYFETSGRDKLAGDGENPTYDLLVSLVQFLNAAKTLKVSETVAESYLIPEFKQYILPEVLRNTFGTLPCIWSFVGDEYYEEAKEVMFGGQEEEWAGLIEKIDYYHYHIMDHLDEILAETLEAGVYVYNIVKYGAVMIPIIENGDAMSDDSVLTSNCSLGATTSTVYGTLSDDYIAGVKAGNGGKYLSPDKQIDASTCLLPDHTWFIKHLYHAINPWPVDEMIGAIFNYDGYTTVFDLEQYPQYLKFNQETWTLSKLEAEEEDAPQAPKYSFFKTLFDFLRRLFRMLKDKIFVKGTTE